jgi:hypothetical protein
MTAFESRTLARRFAQLLDADDLERLGPMLAAGCVYDTGREVLEGPAAVLASYRDASTRARGRFDRLRFDSELVAADDHSAVVLFRDHLTLRGHTHVHICHQRVTFGADGLVTRIEHHELPGERERLEAFLARGGPPL